MEIIHPIPESAVTISIDKNKKCIHVKFVYHLFNEAYLVCISERVIRLLW